jgi:replicative DNA helicase
MTPLELAERYLLSVLLWNPERIADVGPHLASTDFADMRHAAVFTVVTEHLAGRAHQLAQARAARPRPHQWASVLMEVAPEFADYISTAELGTYRALMPTGGGQPHVYAELVMEASIRRQITALGYEAARLSTQTPQLTELLAAHDTINAHLDSIEQRWESITHTRDLARVLDTEFTPGDGRDLDLFGHPVLPTPTTPAPSPEDVHVAQEQVVGAILRNPGVADALLGRLEPTDFLNQALSNAFAAAKQVHTQAARTGRQVDPVTVAWALSTRPEAPGPVPSPEYLHELAHDAELNDLDEAVDLVMRASLAQLIAQAAATAQDAAQHAAISPADVLAKTRSAYQAVDTAARRMTGRMSTDYQFGLLANHAVSAEPTPTTTANLTNLRTRSTTLLHQATTSPSPPGTVVYPGLGARPDGLDTSATSEEVHHDAEPGPT